MSHTSFKDREYLLTGLQEANNILKEKLEKIEIAMSEALYPLQKDTYHFITRMLKPNNRIERTLYSLMYMAAYQSELLSAGSSFVAIQFASSFIDNLLKYGNEILEKNEYELISAFDKTAEKYRKLVSELSTPATFETLKTQIEKICEGDKVLSETILQALEIAGLEGKIHVEDSKQPNYVVEMNAGYNFKLRPFRFFLIDNGIWERKNVKVLVVDGILEKISELDKLLTKSMETKIPMMIVAHGFSEEIIATLKANQDYGKFDVIPVKLQSDLDSLNVVNDIAKVCGTDIVSPLKGDMLIFTQYDSLPTVEKIRCSTQSVSIEHGTTRSSVSQHIRQLLEKRNENHAIEDISNLIDQRIQSLISNAVTIKLPMMSDIQRENTKVKIDVALRTCKTLLNHGSIDLNKVRTNWLLTDDTIDKMFVASIPEVINKEVSTLSAFVGVALIGKHMLSLMCSRGLVEIVT